MSRKFYLTLSEAANLLPPRLTMISDKDVDVARSVWLIRRFGAGPYIIRAGPQHNQTAVSRHRSALAAARAFRRYVKTHRIECLCSGAEFSGE